MIDGLACKLLLDHACRVYSRMQKRLDRPSTYESTVQEHKGKTYIVLRKGGRVLAVYRVRDGASLRRLRGTAAHWRDH